LPGGRKKLAVDEIWFLATKAWRKLPISEINQILVAEALKTMSDADIYQVLLASGKDNPSEGGKKQVGGPDRLK
jgi:hypothetical protein